jgi:hypothetical protein
MAWHKVGRSYLSDDEMRTQGNQVWSVLVDIVLPGFLTYLGVKALSTALEYYHFFMVHTTTTKLINIVAGLIIFCIAHTYRNLIVALAFLAVVGVIALGMFAEFFHWLFA